MPDTKSTYLVLMGTSRQSRVLIERLQAKGDTKIVPFSTNPKKFLEAFKAVEKVLPAYPNDLVSVAKAIKDSNASRI